METNDIVIKLDSIYYSKDQVDPAYVIKVLVDCIKYRRN